jgi:hypothetical protein
MASNEFHAEAMNTAKALMRAALEHDHDGALILVRRAEWIELRALASALSGFATTLLGTLGPDEPVPPAVVPADWCGKHQRRAARVAMQLLVLPHKAAETRLDELWPALVVLAGVAAELARRRFGAHTSDMLAEPVTIAEIAAMRADIWR